MMKIDRDKALGQFRLQLNGIMGVFNIYGLDIEVPRAIDEIVNLALRLHERLNGRDIPIVGKQQRRG